MKVLTENGKGGSPMRCTLHGRASCGRRSVLFALCGGVCELPTAENPKRARRNLIQAIEVILDSPFI